MEHHPGALVPGRVRGHRSEQETNRSNSRWNGWGSKQTGQQVDKFYKLNIFLGLKFKHKEFG